MPTVNKVQIPLTNGGHAMVDQADAGEILKHRWYRLDTKNKQYATRTVRTGEGPRTVYMHRQLLGAKDGEFVDHRDLDGLNNSRDNLRIATPTQNARNSRKKVATRFGQPTSKFKGVHLDSRTGRYQAKIYLGSKGLYLGTFDDPVLAAQEYDKAALEYHGEFARPNFPANEQQLAPTQ
jgi:hypothetical protein